MPSRIGSIPLLAMAVGATLWTAGAIYYDVGRASRWGWVLAAAWCLFVLVLFASWQPLWYPLAVLLSLTLFFVGWWVSLKPSHDRDWDASVAVLPRVVRQGNLVTIENVRNNEYRSFDDFTVVHETRSYHLANLEAVDMILFYWGSPWMSHPVLVFDFGPDGRICMSIEVRFRKGQRYAVVRSLYRQQELIYLAVDERDAVLRRIKHGRCEGYLYRLNEDIDRIRRIFLDYTAAINDLHDHPCWYNAVSANCTTSFYRLPNSRRRWDWRVIVNGWLDRALYDAGRLDRSLPFAELRRTGCINELVQTTPQEGFGDYLRSQIKRRRYG
ncbi:MAG: DUF4105 domain-containing protein [Verrucomicrobiia bacterium]